MLINCVGVGGQVIVEQLTASPWNNFLFMTYLALVVEGNVVLGPKA